MGTVLVICDGSVTGLIAAAATGLKAAIGPKGMDARALVCGPTQHHRKAAAIQAAEFGLQAVPYQDPNANPDPDAWSRCLIDAALRVKRSGGGEVVWPVGPSGREVDVTESANHLSAATLVSQLASLSARDGGSVQVRAPYADLSEDQVADLVLDMDLPIWTCWWMAAAEIGQGEEKSEAMRERERWRAALKRAGWAGSLEAKAAVHVKPAVVASPTRTLGGQP